MSKHQSARSQEPSPGFFRSKVGDANWWMVGIAIFVGFVTYKQWRIAERTLTIANRAYVTATATVHPARITEPSTGPTARALLGEEKTLLKAGDVPFFQVKITNTGLTPAVQVAGAMTSALSTQMPLDLRSVTVNSSEPPWNQQSVSTLAKDGSLVFPVQLGTSLTAEQVQAIEQKKQFLVVFGDIEYVDVFNATHRTEVCFMYLPVVRTMGTCPLHNRID